MDQEKRTRASRDLLLLTDRTRIPKEEQATRYGGWWCPRGEGKHAIDPTHTHKGHACRGGGQGGGGGDFF